LKPWTTEPSARVPHLPASQAGSGDVGLPDAGRRRVPGLRRSEVAALAGVSVEYYARIERTGFAGSARPSCTPLPAHSGWTPPNAHTCSTWPRRRTGRACCCGRGGASSRRGHLDPAAVGARHHHGRAGDRPQRSDGPARRQRAGPGDALIAVRADGRGRPELRPLHVPRRRLHTFYPDWHTAADICVAILRTEAGRDPHDRQLQDLVGELSTLSDEFRRRWSSHEVRLHGAGTKIFHHGVVGDLDLAYESVDMISTPG